MIRRFSIFALIFIFSLSAQAGLPMVDSQGKPLPSLAPMLEKATPAVVNINTSSKVRIQNNPLLDDPFFRHFFDIPEQPRERTTQSLGSGVIVDAKKGYILTNNHVIDKADEIRVTLRDGRSFQAKLVGTDPETDVAVIQIDAERLTAVQLADSDRLRVGDFAVAIGNPFGLGQTVTSGIISALGRSGLGIEGYEDFIQTDASINPGNSGGPLINLNGEIIAVNTAIFSRSGGNMGIGFAIPINMARSVMTSLIEKGRVVRGFLGVIIQDVTQELADAMNVEVNAGVLISSVGKDTPAGKAGIREGDIVTHFNKRRVRSSNALRNTVAGVLPGKEVPVRLIREGKTMDVTVTLVEQPDDMQAAIREGKEGKGENGTEKVSPEDALGLELQPLTPDLASRLGYRGLSGVVVTDVAQGSPAFEAGLREGALIEAVNRVPVANIKAFRAQLAKVASGKSILLLARLNESKRFIVIKKP